MSQADRYVLVTTVESSSSSTRYPIKWDESTQRLTCPCPKWKFSKGDKHCHHVDYARDQILAAGYPDVRTAVRAIIRGAAVPQAPVAPVVDPITADVESFMRRWSGALDGIGRNIMQADLSALLRKYATTKPLAPIAVAPSRPDWLGGGRALILRD